MKNNYYCRAWYKGKKRKNLEQAVSLLKQFDWCDCNELSQDKQNTAIKVLNNLSAIMAVTPYDKKKAEVIEEIRYIEILMRAFKYLCKKTTGTVATNYRICSSLSLFFSHT